MFEKLLRVPDHPALEREILEWWQRDGVFEQLREQNEGGPTFSFIDGPITANKRMGVHHMWGRTLKDVFQRYKALHGFDQRYQNGYDCQGLWVEVGVERELGLNSKREIEEYGLAEFARKCVDKVAWSAEAITQQSQRLGMWMDWGNDYFTFSDTNIEYIWRFLDAVNERGWLTQGQRSTEWCPRCGTAISQHELIGSYSDRTDPSISVRLPLLERKGEALVIWTTTPWTLPANVAAAVAPDAEYGRLSNGDWVATTRFPDETFDERAKGAELVGLAYEGPFDHLAAAAEVEHRVIPWDEVSMDDGTGIVHIAPGCGGEDFELAGVHDLVILQPVDEAGRFGDDYGWLHRMSTSEAREQLIGDLDERGILVESGEIVHRYPHCWRCETPLIFRISDDWFITVEEIRPKLRAANEKVKWVPDHFGKRMDDWLVNMGDWNISRKRFFGLPLPFYPCSCGHVTIIGSLAELREKATAGLEQLQELHRPWIDEVVIGCDSCGEDVRRIPEVGDVWLDAGIVPLSTLGWQSEEWIDAGNGTGAANGLTGAPLPDHAYWEKWFPATWVSEMREQIRLWFHSIAFMSMAMVERLPYESVLSYEKLLDEHGHEMHGSPRERNRRRRGVRADRRRRDALDVLLTAAEPEHPLRLWTCRRGQTQAAHPLELGRVLHPVRRDRRVRSVVRRSCRGPGRRGRVDRSRSLARLTHTRARSRVRRLLRGLPDSRCDRRARALCRRSVELVHPAQSAALLGGDRRRCVPDALVRARAGDQGDWADHAVSGGAPVAEAGRRWSLPTHRRVCSWPGGPRRAPMRSIRSSWPRCLRHAGLSSSAGPRAAALV